MGIRFYKPYTPSTRNRSVSDFNEITPIHPSRKIINFLDYFVQKDEIIEVL